MKAVQVYDPEAKVFFQCELTEKQLQRGDATLIGKVVVLGGRDYIAYYYPPNSCWRKDVSQEFQAGTWRDAQGNG